jgi:hypothetical protein
MKNMTSKLARVLVVTLIFAAAVTTASSQEKQMLSLIYGIDNDGALKLYRHNGAATGAAAWEGPNNVGVGWNDYKTVFPGGANIIYGIKADGTLEWRQHQGLRRGSDQWGDTKIVGRGWGDFNQVFSGGGGIIYAITQEGKLLWYKHNGYLDGTGVGSPGAWEGPKEVGSGWNSFKQVFPAGNGIIFAITREGKLLWYRHTDYANGVKAWEPTKEVGRGWGDFKNVFSSGDGVIYAITQDGKLQWRRYNGYMSGGGYDTWQGPTEAATGWGDFFQAFALLPGSSAPVREQRPRTSEILTPADKSGAGPVLDQVYANVRDARSKPTSNEIRCRGSRDGLIFTAENSKVDSTGETIIITLLTFEPGPYAAGPKGEGLRPGECSWVDRPINQRFLITFETPANAQLKQKLHGSQVDTSPTAAERYPDARTIPAYMNDPKHYWSFFGGRAVNNFFVATGHRYFSPFLDVASPVNPK